MNIPKREIKDIFVGDEAKNKISAGAKKIYEAVSSTYGPAGNNVMLGFPFGDSTLTRDGVTVAKRTILKDKAEDDAATVLRQASEKTNKTAGDGTTATIVLGYHLYNNGQKLVVAGESGMKLSKQIVKDSQKVIEFLKSESIPADDYLLEVATVSSGDPAIGALVSDTLKEIGNNGGITIKEQSYPTIDVEKVGGYYFDKGFFALTQPMELTKPQIFVTNRPLTSHSDVIPLLSHIINSDNRTIVLIGDVRMNSDAMNTIMRNVLENKLNCVIVPPPAFSDEGLLFMQDIALYVGSKLFLNGEDPASIKGDGSYFGTAEKVVVSQSSAIIFKGGGADEDIEVRANEIKDSIKKETNAHRKDNLEQRYAKLTGKIAIVNVGGSTPTEGEELKYRVEDAIEATKSAMADGVIPGGGTMYIRASQLDISKLFKDALLDSFRKLMTNASEPADYRLEQIRRANKGFGFNLRDITDEPIDLTKVGIWDATRAITQVVENATSAAASLLTVGAIIDPVESGKDETF
jgi:chaperonin GroEL